MPPNFQPLSSEAFIVAALDMIGRSQFYANTVMQRRFRSMFGVSSAVCAAVWDSLANELPTGGCPIHLLWSLLFLKTYATEHVNSSIAGVDEKTFRKWTWRIIQLISYMPIVSGPCLFVFNFIFYDIILYFNTKNYNIFFCI